MAISEKLVIRIIGLFLFFGAATALLAAITLLYPGTPLDKIWAINPTAYEELLPFAKGAGIGFLLLSPILILAGYGVLQRKRWGWKMAVFLIGANAVGDVVNLLRGEVFKGIFGVVIALAILFYLLTPKVRNMFAE